MDQDASSLLTERLKKATSDAIAATLAYHYSGSDTSGKAMAAAFSELAAAAREPFEVALHSMVDDMNRVLEQRDNLYAALADVIAVLAGKPVNDPQPYANAAAMIAVVVTDEAYPPGARLPASYGLADDNVNGDVVG